MANTYFKNAKLIEATGTPTDSTYYYKVPNEKLPYTVNVFRSTPDIKYVSERGIINGIPISIDNSYYKGISQYSDSLIGGYPVQSREGKQYKHQVDKVTQEFQQGGTLDIAQVGKLAKAAFQMANELKKQGAITEVAGEQVIAQAFQQTPEAAKMFVEAAQKQDAETILQLFTKLGIVK